MVRTRDHCHLEKDGEKANGKSMARKSMQIKSMDSHNKKHGQLKSMDSHNKKHQKSMDSHKKSIEKA